MSKSPNFDDGRDMFHQETNPYALFSGAKSCIFLLLETKTRIIIQIAINPVRMVTNVQLLYGASVLTGERQVLGDHVLWPVVSGESPACEASARSSRKDFRARND